MDRDFDEVLDRYTARMEEERRIIREQPQRLYEMRDQLLLSVGREAADFLRSLIIARGATRILELGTSYGYSTLFLADAARRTGGQVITMDVAADKQDYARRELAGAGLDSLVDFQTGDALDLLEAAPGPFDFVLLDIWKDVYVPAFEIFRHKLVEHAIIAADNMLQPEMARPDAEKYRAAVRACPEFQSVLLPIGQGIELSCLWRNPSA
jgi:predicted O-methyltransferase YrrM